MNKKGFTVVELIASFALTLTISVFLFEVLIDVKDVFVETSIKTSIIEKVGVISKNINLNVPKVCTKTGCPGLISYSTDTITVNGQIFELPSGVTISDFGVTGPSCSDDDCILTVAFKLNHASLAEPYDYKVVYYFNS